MGKLICHQGKVDDLIAAGLVNLCPFNALENKNGIIEINSGCKMCMICVKKGPPGVMEFVGEEALTADKSLWRGIGVYVDHIDGAINPVTLELIGKAKELAGTVGFPVYCVFVGYNVQNKAEELLHYGVDEVFVYDCEELKDFKIEPYTVALEDFVYRVKPSSFLIGATTIGRTLAPRVAARFKTGLTADCTRLEMRGNTDLIQIRPAFGGNIMAQIICPKTRPQMATIRYKVMNAPARDSNTSGKITVCELDRTKLASGIDVLKVTKKEAEESISDAEVIVAVGRAFKAEKEMTMARELAQILGGRIAGTRPLAEAGLIKAKQQIGLSGRTVKPKLMITLGVSGSVQFAAGMSGSEHIFAINSDPNAPIFNIAHYGIVGDVYEVVPCLIKEMRTTSAGG